jgi:hypothetical protein
MLRTIKLDLADLNRHVTIEKESGTWRQFRLTPAHTAVWGRPATAARARPAPRRERR